MKKRLNILCLLIILILLVSVSINGYYSGLGAKLGIESVQEMDKKGKLDMSANMHAVGLLPTIDNFLADSLYNEKTGEYVHVSYMQAIVSVKTESGTLHLIANLLLLVSFIAAIAAVVFFFKFIIAVNRSEIFIWANVSRLRWTGGLLIIAFLGSLLPMIETSFTVSNLLQLKGYDLYFTDLVSVTSLLLGVLAYVVAEVFAIGIKMKEEQELTI